MATIHTAIELQDHFSAVLYQVMDAVNLSISAMEDMQQNVSQPIDTSSIEAARDAMNDAAAAAIRMEELSKKIQVPSFEQKSIPDPMLNIPNQPDPIQQPVQWQSYEGLEVFKNTGVERFQQEVTSVNSMLRDLNAMQSHITQTAAESEILSPQARYDVELIENRLQVLRESIEQMEQNPLNIGSDSANADLEHLRARLSKTLEMQENLNTAMQGMDISQINTAYLQLSQSISETERKVRDSFENIQPVPIPVTWKTDNLDFFTSTGIDRFQQEIQSANSMLEMLNSTQEHISATAAQTDLFPENSISDINGVRIRLQTIWQQVQQIENNPLNMGTEGANAGLEQLRSQLSQLIQEQESLNQAVADMDVQAANEAYLRLIQTVGNTERYIRDNIDEQGRFNQKIQEGTRNAGGLTNIIKRIAGAYLGIQGLKNVIDLSDTMTQTTARLSLIVDDGGSVEELQNKVYASAQNARADYMQTADMISKMGAQAADAFSSNDELIGFAELLNKSFVNAGTSVQGIDSVMLQLTQSMAAGKLQGEELNAILDNAAPIVQNIQQYLEEVQGIDASNIKQLASDGMLTAQVVKNAMFYAADEINEKFESMPMTWEQAWTSVKNAALLSFQPALQQINEIAQTEEFHNLVTGIINMMQWLGLAAAEAMNALGTAVSFAQEHLWFLLPVLGTVVAAVLLYKGAVSGYNFVQGISNGLKTIATIREVALGRATATAKAETIGMTTAQLGMNAALLACPLTWIVVAIIGLVVAIYLVVGAINKFKGTSISATGMVAAVFAGLGASIYNKFIVPTWNTLADFGNFIANFGTKPVESVKILFYDMASTVIGYIINMMESIESIINRIPGMEVDITAGLDRFRDSIEEASQEVKDESGWKEVIERKDYLNIEETVGDAYKWGAEKESSFKDLFQGNELDDLYKQQPWEIPFDNIVTNTGNTAGNTAAMADSMDMAEEDLKSLRDMAETEVINRFTTAELTVNMGGVVNQVNSNMDLDGIGDYLEAVIAERLEVAAEGVY